MTAERLGQETLEEGRAAFDGYTKALVDDQHPLIDRFQPAWATRARLLADAGRPQDAVVAYRHALSLTTEPAIRRFLENRLHEVR